MSGNAVMTVSREPSATWARSWSTVSAGLVVVIAGPLQGVGSVVVEPDTSDSPVDSWPESAARGVPGVHTRADCTATRVRRRGVGPRCQEGVRGC